MRHAALFGAALVGLAAAHGDHSKTGRAPEVDPNADWMTKHMAGTFLARRTAPVLPFRLNETVETDSTRIEEHHADTWDSGSFFTLHDYNSDGRWTTDEMLRTYGLMDESNKRVSLVRRDEIARDLLSRLDDDGDGSVSAAEWQAFMAAGNTLPDLGTGPGHHGDDEYEYEIHHWEKYHGEDTKLEDLTHPEDIEHFRKHEQQEEEQARLEAMEKIQIIEDNIPLKFRRGS